MSNFKLYMSYIQQTTKHWNHKLPNSLSSPDLATPQDTRDSPWEVQKAGGEGHLSRSTGGQGPQLAVEKPGRYVRNLFSSLSSRQSPKERAERVKVLTPPKSLALYKP